MTSSGGAYKYSLLSSQDEDIPSGSNNTFEDIMLKQQVLATFTTDDILFQQIVRDQDDNLEIVGQSVSTLKNMSHQIGDELDHQAM